jgi:hypothetical protein
MRFKIEYISPGKPFFLFARQLDKGTFAVVDISTLGGLQIRDCVRHSCKFAPDGLPDLTVFTFQLCTVSDLSLMELGSIVTLNAVS